MAHTGSRDREARVELLGPVACTMVRGGRRRDFPFVAERPCQLLAYLAVRGDWVGRDQLAALFWPDKGNDAARRNLRRVLHGARHLAFANDIETRGDLVRWPIATDVCEFDQALQEGRLDEAVALVRGPLCEGIESPDCGDFAEWLAFERNRVAERWRTAALALAPRIPPQASHDLAERMLTVDSFDEEAVRTKIAALVALGRSAEAKRVYRRFAEHLAEELGVEPSAALRSMVATLDGSLPVAARPAAASERAPEPRLVGREDEIEETLALLAQPETRLVTITGPGGIGKTSLAREVAARGGARFGHAPLWVDLDELASPDQIVMRLATSLGLALEPQVDPLSQVVQALKSSQKLVVLDNSEHLISASDPASTKHSATAIVTTLLDACPKVVVLVTSRVRLLARGERLLPLGGLAVPANDDPNAVLRSAAAQLFCARARMALASFDPLRQAAGIAAICRLTEGLPLALELAAAWVRLLPCDEIAAQLRAGLDLLEPRTGSKGVCAAFDRSWQLAAPHEREVLARLSVFAGSFTYEAARAVADARWPSLANLVDASLIRVEPGSNGRRFGLHPLLREYARVKLADDPADRETARARHAEFFTRYLARFGDFKRVDRRTAFDDIERELADCTLAWTWAVERGSAEHISLAAVALTRFFESRGRADEAIVLFERALQSLDTRRSAHLPALAKCAIAMGSLQVFRGLHSAAETTARRSLAWARASGQRGLRAEAMSLIGRTLWEQGRSGDARRYFDAVLAFARAEGDDDDTVAALTQLAACDQVLGNYKAAEAACREAVTFRRAAGEPFALTVSLQRLGDLLRSMDDYEPALPIFEEGLRLAEANGYERYRPIFLMELGLTHCELKHFAEAADHTQRALAAARELGMTKIELIVLEILARLATFDGDTAASRRWLATAMRIEQATANVPMQLETASIYAEALAAEGTLERPAVIWTYVAAHDKADDQNRRRAADMLARLGLSEAVLDAAKREAARLDLEALAKEIRNATQDVSRSSNPVASAVVPERSTVRP
jgi:predicted ATPase/DNA-binding SARP family transcriptional activator